MEKNEYLVCAECEGVIEENRGQYFCANCGKEYREVLDNDESEATEVVLSKNEEEQAALIEKNERKTMITATIFCLFVVALIVVGGISKGGFFTKKITKILEENNFPSTEYSIVSILDTEEEDIVIKGLIEDSRLLLLKHSLSGCSEYTICEIDVENRQVREISFTIYKPLEIVLSYIMDDKSLEFENIDNFDRIIRHMEKYGIRCFDNEEYAKLYYDEITGENGLIPVQEARKLLKNSVHQFVPEVKEILSAEIVFEGDSAKPTHYCVQIIEQVYSFVIPEDAYSTWYANVDKKTRDMTFAIYGSPYKEKKLWSLYDVNNKKLGTFEDKDTMYKYIETRKIKDQAKENTVSKAGTTIIYRINHDEIEKNLLTIAKEIIDRRLKNMGYDSQASINGDRIEVILPIQNDIRNTAEQLIPDYRLTFRDYLNNTVMTEADIHKVEVESEEKNKEVYGIVLEFTEEGKEKFKAATSDISKLPSPNNYLSIMVNNSVISAPVIVEEVDSKQCTIIGNFSRETADDFAFQIIGAMYAPIFTIEEVY